MSATKTFFRSASPGEQGQFARRAADSQAGHVVDTDREGIISFPALGPGSHLQGSAFARTGPSAADVLPLTQDPVNLPLDELSAAAITALLRSAASAGHQAACLWFRTGKYGVIEEIHGHAAGLKLMKHIEARLGECLREDDVLCRVTDNEFVIVLYGIEDMTHVASVADRVLAHCGGIYDTGDLRLHVGASIGIAMYPADAAQPHDGKCALWKSRCWSGRPTPPGRRDVGPLSGWTPAPERSCAWWKSRRSTIRCNAVK